METSSRNMQSNSVYYRNVDSTNAVSDYIFSWYDEKVKKIKTDATYRLWRYAMGMINLIVYALIIGMLFLTSNKYIVQLLNMFGVKNGVNVSLLLLAMVFVGYMLSLFNDTIGLMAVAFAGFSALYKSGVFFGNEKNNWFIFAFGIVNIIYPMMKIASNASIGNFADFPMLVNVFKYSTTVSIILALLSLTGYSKLMVGKGSGGKDGSMFYNTM